MLIYPNLQSLKQLSKLLIIYSGSFSPPHVSHMNVMIDVMKVLPHAKMFMVPVNDLYPKSGLITGFNSDGVNHRFLMCKMTVNEILKTYPVLDISASDYTFQIDKPKIDRDIVIHFSELYPDYKIACIIGQDVYDNMDSWDEENKKEILSGKYEIIVYPRTNSVSSSNIRNNKAYQDLLESVKNYYLKLI